jgi:ubiquitin-like 1-activating enzyme E1 B
MAMIVCHDMMMLGQEEPLRLFPHNSNSRYEMLNHDNHGSDHSNRDGGAAALSASSRYDSYRLLYGDSVFSSIQSSKILVVGAGGIGCELLKNLVLTGFSNLEVIDLDTIDVSNLNRQFLFRKQHVGQSKSIIANAAVKSMNPFNQKLAITSYHDNIKNQDKFSLDYFKQFQVVCNALDNIEARRHVNRICLAIPEIHLIESGTQGYLGQTTVIKPRVTECFECNPIQSGQRSYAVCTIRNTPDQPIHTIVWGKYIFNALFGPKDDDNIMNDVQLHSHNTKQARTTATELFQRLFFDEVNKQIEVKDRWVNRKAPIPLDLTELLSQLPHNNYNYTRADAQRVLSTAENASLFINTVEKLLLTRENQFGSLLFDKDDELAMEFVSSASNLRSFIYSIPSQSLFTVKGIAGNIIHAIATTNAVAAGLIVQQLINILAGNFNQCKTTWIVRQTTELLRSQPLEKPRTSCFICGQTTLFITLNTNNFTVKQFFERILIKKLGFNEPSIDVFSANNFIGTREDHAEDNLSENDQSEEKHEEKGPKLAYLDRNLSDPGVLIGNGAQMSVDDQTQSLQVNITIVHSENLDEEKFPEGFSIQGRKEIHRIPAKTALP